MDIPDYLTNSEIDKKEWIQRKILFYRWDLRRKIEEIEFTAEQFQMKIKYGGNQEELKELKTKLKILYTDAQEMATQIHKLS